MKSWKGFGSYGKSDAQDKLKEFAVGPALQDICDALTDPLTDEERNPTPIDPALLGYDVPDVVSLYGNTEADVYRQFNEYAMEHQFGDGLPMIPPTRERVDAMLAATTRSPDEVLGKLRMRKGIATVEKVAINAVMAGAKPEYFPVILAALEGLSEEIENYNRFHHSMTSGASYSFLIVVSGAIAKEIGMNSETAFFGSGNDANNTIGRAIRMCYRNIGHNWQPHIDTARTGRHNDLTFFVVAEDEDALPEGWVTLHEDIGFAADQNTVTVIGVGRYLENAKSTGGAGYWTPQGIVTSVRGSGDLTTGGIAIFTPVQAKAIAEDLGLDKNRLRTTGASNGGGYGSATTRVFPIVAGEDPGFSRVFTGMTYSNGQNFKTQLITGATLTEAGRDPTPPGTPLNFAVLDTDTDGNLLPAGQVRLTWDAPAVTDGKKPISGYEVTAQERDYGRWVTVPGGDSARSVTLSGLVPGKTYYFRVRAISGEYRGGFGTFNGVGGSRIPGTTLTVDLRGSGAGGLEQGVSWGTVAARGGISSLKAIVPVTDITSAPQNLAATTITETSIALSWAAPATIVSANSAAIMWYEVSIDGVTWTPVKNYASSLNPARTYTINGLTANTMYVVLVRPMTSEGAGAESGITVTTTAEVEQTATEIPAETELAPTVLD